jgi:hypothetical protein
MHSFEKERQPLPLLVKAAKMRNKSLNLKSNGCIAVTVDFLKRRGGRGGDWASAIDVNYLDIQCNTVSQATNALNAMVLKARHPTLKARMKSLPALIAQECMFQIVEDVEPPEICSFKENS